ncbi:MAG: hypothetical protein HXY20_07035 [Acidobacteria bacterium]|nr:hypothetical protein [Acidobacteriota bacterium]
MKKLNPCLCAVLVSLLFVAGAHAQKHRTFRLGPTVDVAGGVGNMMGESGFIPLFGKTVPFFGASPSVEFSTAGERSQLDLGYSYVWERYQTTPRLAVDSHVLDAKLTSRLSRGVGLTITDTFRSVPDYSAFRAFRAGPAASADFSYSFDTLAARQSITDNNARGQIAIDVTSRSALTFGASSAFRQYSRDAGYQGWLSDQVRTQGDAALSYKASAHTSWRFKYAFIHNNFEKFGTFITQTASAGLSHQPSPKYTLDLEAGPSYTIMQDGGEDHPGYIASAGLTRTVRTNRFSVRYNRRAGDSNGFGSISDTHNASADFYQLLGNRLIAGLNFQGFDSRYRRDSPTRTMRGYYGSASLGIVLSRNWLLMFGGSYRRNQGWQYTDIDFSRFMVALRFQAPNLFRWST